MVLLGLRALLVLTIVMAQVYLQNTIHRKFGRTLPEPVAVLSLPYSVAYIHSVNQCFLSFCIERTVRICRRWPFPVPEEPPLPSSRSADLEHLTKVLSLLYHLFDNDVNQVEIRPTVRLSICLPGVRVWNVADGRQVVSRASLTVLVQLLDLI